MFRSKVIAVFLLTTVFVSGAAYSSPQQNKQVKTITGTIAKMDVEGGVVDVDTDHGTMSFYISIESDLFRSSHHMSSIEIEQGDPVVIQYITALGQNNIITLVDNKSIG